MHTGEIVFAQLTSHLPIRRFHTLVKRYSGEYKVKAFSCLDQIFAQLAMCSSLRDIEASLSANPKSLYHLGICSRIRHFTLAGANEKRDARIFEEFAKILIVEARKLYTKEKSDAAHAHQYQREHPLVYPSLASENA
jgi:hypothetical protein